MSHQAAAPAAPAAINVADKRDKITQSQGKVLVLSLGLFEFYNAFVFFVDAESKVGQGTILPNVYSQFPVRILFCMFLMTLGMQRLTWW